MHYLHFPELGLTESIVVIDREEEGRFEVRAEYVWDRKPFPDFEQGRKEIYWHKYGNGGCVAIVDLPNEPYFKLPTYEERLIEFLETSVKKNEVMKHG